jgi:hypothetical protein
MYTETSPQDQGLTRWRPHGQPARPPTPGRACMSPSHSRRALSSSPAARPPAAAASASSAPPAAAASRADSSSEARASRRPSASWAADSSSCSASHSSRDDSWSSWLGAGAVVPLGLLGSRAGRGWRCGWFQGRVVGEAAAKLEGAQSGNRTDAPYACLGPSTLAPTPAPAPQRPRLPSRHASRRAHPVPRPQPRVLGLPPRHRLLADVVAGLLQAGPHALLQCGAVARLLGQALGGLDRGALTQHRGRRGAGRVGAGNGGEGVAKRPSGHLSQNAAQQNLVPRAARRCDAGNSTAPLSPRGRAPGPAGHHLPPTPAARAPV